MCRGGHDADFHSLLISGLTGCETAVGGIAVVSLNGIAEVVGEHGDACHACHILLESSVKYWAKEFHIDGFRFDLMGIHDIETMNRVARELKEINPSI